jgi:hypothetical protein
VLARPGDVRRGEVELHERREVYNGFGDGLARAFELALTPALFGGLGHLLDVELGLRPLLTIVLFLFGVAGTSYMAWFRYEAEMRRVEADKPWARRRVGGAS